MQRYYKNIAEVLKKKNISQRQFAKQLNVPYSTFTNWILGVCDPSLEIVLKSADLLKISIDKVIFQRSDKDF